MNKRITLGAVDITDLEKQYVNERLDANFISPGPIVKEVEQLVAEMHRYRHAICLNSGQSAIQVGIQALIKKLAEKHPDRNFIQEPALVAVPASTYISTVSAVRYAGCHFVLVDVGNDGNMHPMCLGEALNNAPIEIVVPVHLYGKACKPEIREICEAHDVLVLEDACESTFAPNIGWGHVCVTSFFSNHLISGGSGGAIMTDDDDLAFSSWQLVNHGREAKFDNDDIHRIADKFRFDVWGHSYKWSDVPAAIVKAQIERKDEMYAKRRRNALCLIEMLQDLPLILPDPKEHVFMMFPIIVNNGINAKRTIKYLNDHDIEVRRMMPITNQTVIKRYFGAHIDLDREFFGAANINTNGFYIGCHHCLSLEDMEYVGTKIREAVRLFHDR